MKGSHKKEYEWTSSNGRKRPTNFLNQKSYMSDMLDSYSSESTGQTNNQNPNNELKKKKMDTLNA